MQPRTHADTEPLASPGKRQTPLTRQRPSSTSPTNGALRTLRRCKRLNSQSGMPRASSRPSVKARTRTNPTRNAVSPNRAIRRSCRSTSPVIRRRRTYSTAPMRSPSPYKMFRTQESRCPSHRLLWSLIKARQLVSRSRPRQ